MGNRTQAAYAGVFLVAASIILFEIAMTRVFAIMMWHHLTYMVLSVALVGLGAAGSILTVRRASAPAPPSLLALVSCSMIYGVTAIGAFFASTLVEFDSLEIWSRPGNFFALLLIYSILAVPMLFGGLVLGLAIIRYADRVDRLYFADLLGSAAGAAVSGAVLGELGNTPAVLSAGCLALLGSLAFSFGAPVSRRILPSVCVAASIGLIVAFSTGDLSWNIPFAPGKEMSDAPGTRPEVRLASPTGEVEVTASHMSGPAMGGNFGWRDWSEVESRFAAQDGTAPTQLFKNASDIAAFPFLDDTQAASAYVCHRATQRTNPSVLVIGVGGGIDVMVALAHGARHVTAVEVNSAMIEMVRAVFDDYLGGLFRPGAHALSDRVDLHKAEGRSFVRRRDDSYDVIQLSGTDTFTALSTGVYTLAESYLYTVEAVQDLFQHLTGSGYINYSRFILAPPKKPRETLRLAHTALAALEGLGVPDPASHICVFQGINWASTMIKRSPFTQVEIEALDQFAADEGFVGVVFDPLRGEGKPVTLSAGLVHAALPELRDFVRQSILPAAHGAVEEREIRTLMRFLAEAVAATAADDPLRVGRALGGFTALLPEESRIVAGDQFKAALDPAARLVAERVAAVGELRREFSSLLGGDAGERRRFVEDYEFDVSPCTDDRPFFFNYYKYSGLLRAKRGPADSWYYPDFPVGHMVLLTSTLQILLLAVVLILFPLRRLKRSGARTVGRFRYLAYFSSLGIGFMCIEIVMMQKLVMFLGHPTYAVSVALSGLLAAAGLGSRLSGRFDASQRMLVANAGAIVFVILGGLVAVNHLFPALMGSPLPVRVALALLLLLVVGLPLGMAFPTGIRLVKERCPELVPWAWAVNALTSVLGSIVCIMVAMEIGFTFVLAATAAVYAAGFVAMLSTGAGFRGPSYRSST